MNPYFILAALLAAGVLTGGAYYQGRQDGADGELATQKREEDVARIASDASAKAAAAAIARVKVANTTIMNEVQHEISERVVYRECLHSPDQLRRLNAALAGRPESAGTGVLPRAGAASGPEFRRHDE